jgi:DNA polymerase-3 subunit beta
MKFEIERASLLKSLSHVQSVVERRNTIPILSNILIEAAGGKVAMTATDLDMSIVERVAADVGQDGATTTPAQTLYDIVRKLPDGSQIELAEEADGRLLVRAGRSQFHLPCLDRQDFPITDEGDLPSRFDIGAPALRRLIRKTRFAVSTEETRYYLNGIYLHTAEVDGVAVLRAVATDGHRLAQVDMPLPDGAAGIPGVIVPRKVVNELFRLIEDLDGPITVSLSDDKIRVEFGETVLSSKLIDGTFPDYQRVIPEGNDKVLSVTAKDLIQAIDRVATVSTEKSRAVKIAVEKAKAVLSANSAENASATEELSVDYNAESLEVGFNSKYLIDILNECEGENAQFWLADAVSPTIVRDENDEGALYVLMPMRV